MCTSLFWGTQAVLPTMYEANHGHIVTIASSAGLCGVPGLADYCASKHAAVGFDESIRMEARKLGKFGVKTTVVRIATSCSRPIGLHSSSP